MLVTGAGSGIGRETARHAARAGYRLVLASRGRAALEALRQELGESRSIAVPMDVSSWEDNENAVQAALDHFDRLDVVFANAGFAVDRGWRSDSPERWREMVLTNVLGVALTVRAALPALTSSSGQIVMTGSLAGRTVTPGSLYSATKWAVTAMADAVRADVAGTGVRTTLIQPGATDTPAIRDRSLGVLNPEDVARVVLFALAQPPTVDISEIVMRPVPPRSDAEPGRPQ
jgi:NADP-dependent 3-hydroxy acid dehydrogenase YdfG